MTLRRQLRDVLSTPRTVSSLAQELGLRKGEVEADLRHAIRSARASGDRVVIEPARCKQCGFLFDPEKLSKPGKCPACRGTRIFEPLVSIARGLCIVLVGLPLVAACGSSPSAPTDAEATERRAIFQSNSAGPHDS